MSKTEEDEVESASTQRKAKPRKTRFIFKLLGLLLVVIAGWIGWYSYRQGKLVDLTDPAQQKQALEQAKQDFDEAKKTTVSWAKRGIDDLKKLLKEKAPETKEEISQLVNESKKALEPAFGGPPAAGGGPAAKSGGPPANATPSKAGGAFEDAQNEYRAGEEAYVHTDPASPSEQIQKYIRLAAPHFEKCLDMLEEARKRGVNGPEIDRLEQKAAKRLIDCRRRMELH